jgi:hypothetical protein
MKECINRPKSKIVLLLILLSAIQFSLGGSSPYTSTDKTNNIHKRNNTKTQYKQYKTQKIQVHILPKHPHITKPTHTHTHTLQKNFL